MDRKRRAAVVAAALLFSTASASVEGLILYTDHAIYAPGEDILVTLTNDTSSDIFMSASPPFLVRPADGDSIVAPCGWWTVVVGLAPAETRNYRVQQIECSSGDGVAWADGPYEVSVDYRFGNDPETRATVTRLICIGDNCPELPDDGVYPSTWGHVKESYRETTP